MYVYCNRYDRVVAPNFNSFTDDSEVKGKESEEMDIEETEDIAPSIVPGTAEEVEETVTKSGRRGRGRKTPGRASARKTGL